MEYKYDVAISFGEEDKGAAVALKNALEQEGLRTYYYPDNRADDAGYELAERLTKIYSEEAAFAVVLSSIHFFNEEKTYTRIELDAIKARMEADPDMVYLVPVKLDSYQAPEPFGFINSLIHLEWNYQPGEIAKIIKEIVGKELSEATQESFLNHVIYNYGDPMLMVQDSNIHSFNPQIIKNRIVNYGGTVEAGNSNVNNEDAEISDSLIAGRDINIGFKKSKDTRFACPFCYEELDSKVYGQQFCKHCRQSFYLKNHERDKDVIIYKTLNPDEAKKLDKIIAHINNNLRDRNYEEAYRHCKKAEELAPGEVATWKYFALTEFLLEITRDKITRKSTFLIVRSIKTHIDKCMDHGMTDPEYDDLVIDIANRLFNIEKARIGSYQSQYTDAINGQIWTKANLAHLEKLLRSFEICHQLYDDPLFLKEYVAELTKPYKWVIMNLEGTIINTPACGYFDAAGKISMLKEKIRKKERDYELPKIPEERFLIRKLEYFKINSITPKINYGEENHKS